MDGLFQLLTYVLVSWALSKMLIIALIWSYFTSAVCSVVDDNINGVYQVSKHFHYANKSSIVWGLNSASYWSVQVIMPEMAATYDCSNTTSYTCSDPIWYYDWNKLWASCLYQANLRLADDSHCLVNEEDLA